MSDTESPGDMELNAKERGSAAWAFEVDKLICSEEGAKRVQHYVRKYVKAGGDLDELCEDLAQTAKVD